MTPQHCQQLIQFLQAQMSKAAVSEAGPSHKCTICPLAKFKRLPLCSKNNFSPYSFDLIHCDIWGPYGKSTYNGKHIFYYCQ